MVSAWPTVRRCLARSVLRSGIKNCSTSFASGGGTHPVARAIPYSSPTMLFVTERMSCSVSGPNRTTPNGLPEPRPNLPDSVRRKCVRCARPPPRANSAERQLDERHRSVPQGPGRSRLQVGLQCPIRLSCWSSDRSPAGWPICCSHRAASVRVHGVGPIRVAIYAINQNQPSQSGHPAHSVCLRQGEQPCIRVDFGRIGSGLDGRRTELKGRGQIWPL